HASRPETFHNAEKRKPRAEWRAPQGMRPYVVARELARNRAVFTISRTVGGWREQVAVLRWFWPPEKEQVSPPRRELEAKRFPTGNKQGWNPAHFIVNIIYLIGRYVKSN